MAMRKSVFKYEVVYDDEEVNFDCASLEDLAHETTEGCASGRFLDTEDTVLDYEEAYAALEAQGSDPEFLNLRKCGNCGIVFRVIGGFYNEAPCPKCGHKQEERD